MNLITKGGIVIGTIGGVSGISYAVAQKFKSNDIASKLIQERYEILNDESDEWKNILKVYIEKIKTEKDLKFENFDGTKNTQNELQKLCNEATKLDLSKDTKNITYNKAKKWCTKPRLLTSILKDKGYKMLNTSSEGDPDTESWNSKLNLYKKKDENIDKKFTDLTLIEDSTSNKDITNRSKLRKKCKDLENKKHYEQNFEKELEQAILWCSIINN